MSFLGPAWIFLTAQTSNLLQQILVTLYLSHVYDPVHWLRDFFRDEVAPKGPKL